MTTRSVRASVKKTKTNVLQKTRFALTPLAAAIMVASYPATPVQAAEERKVIEEMIVTATKRSSDLQDVAQSISAFSEADLDQMGVKTMEDYLRAMPSVSLTSTHPGRNSLVMRGISSNPFQYRTDSQVAVYLDEQPMTTNSQQVSVRTIDMQRIESLPGPQGTVFGASSQSGTLRLITNKPNHDGFSGSIDASYGATTDGDGSFDVNGHLNIPLIDDVLAVRAVAYTSHDGGWIDNVLGTTLSGNFDNAALVEDNFNEYDVNGGRVNVLWNIGENWTALFGFVTEITDSEGTWENDAQLGDHEVTRFFDEWRDDDWYSAAITLKGDLGFAELTIAATHFDRDIAYEWDNNEYAQRKDNVYGGAYLKYTADCYAANPNYGDYSCYFAGYYAGFTNAPRYNSDYSFSTIVNDQSQQRDSIEIRLTSQGASKLQWMIGGYYEDVYDEWYYYTEVPNLTNTTAWAASQAYAYYYKYAAGYDSVQYPLPDTTVGYSNTMERTVKQIAVFGELGYDITDNFSVTAGVRWSEFERDEFDIYQWPEGLASFGGYGSDGGYGEKGKNDDVIYKLGAQYNIDEDRMVYFLFSQGFKLGGVNSSRAANTGLIPKTFDADFLNNYELGIKSQWLDQRLQINASVFLMKWDDYHDTVFGIGPWWVRGTVNAETAESKGIEINATWQATDRLQFRGSVYLGNAEFTDTFLDPGDGDVEIRDGMPMPGAPDEKAWLSITYDIPNVFGGDLWFYYDVSYQSETWNHTSDIRDRDMEGLSPSWTISNLRVGLELENDLTFTLMVSNLFDEPSHSYTSTTLNGYAELFGQANPIHNIRAEGRPRTAWLSMKKRF